jgi:hypothetical protein
MPHCIFSLSSVASARKRADCSYTSFPMLCTFIRENCHAFKTAVRRLIKLRCLLEPEHNVTRQLIFPVFLEEFVAIVRAVFIVTVLLIIVNKSLQAVRSHSGEIFLGSQQICKYHVHCLLGFEHGGTRK